MQINKMKILFALDPWIYRDSAGNQIYTLEKIFAPAIAGLVRHGHDVKLFLGEDMFDAVIAKKLKIECEIKVVQLKELYQIYGNHYDAHKLQFEEASSKKQKRLLKELIEKSLDLWCPEAILSFTTPVAVWKEFYPEAIAMQFENGLFSRSPYPYLCQLDQFGFLKKSYAYVFLDQLRNKNINSNQLERLRNLRSEYQNRIFEKYNPFSADEIRDWPGQKVLLVPLSYNGAVINDAASNFKSQLDFLLKVLHGVPENVIVLYTKHSLQSRGEIPEETETYLLNKFSNLRYLKKFDQYAFSSQWLTPLVDGIVSLNSTVAYHGAFWGKKVFALGDCEINSVAIANNLDNVEAILNEKMADDPKAMNVVYHLLTRYCFSLKLFLDAKWLSERLEILMANKEKKLLESEFESMPLIEDEDRAFERLLSEAPGIIDGFQPRVKIN